MIQDCSEYSLLPAVWVNVFLPGGEDDESIRLEDDTCQPNTVDSTNLDVALVTPGARTIATCSS